MFWYVQPIGHQLLIGEGPTYGYRRITALANRELGRTGEPVINHKRMFRIMRQNGMLLARHTGRRNGRLHDGKVVVMGSNLRWSSDGVWDCLLERGHPSPELNAPMGRSESPELREP